MEKYNESFEIARKVGDQNGIAITVGAIGILLARTRKYQDAIAHLFTSYDMFDQMGIEQQKLKVMQNIEKIRKGIGENEFEEIKRSLSLQR